MAVPGASQATAILLSPDGTSMNSTLSTSILVRQFQEFYREIVRLKQLVASETWSLSAVQMLDEETMRSRAVTAVWQRLLSLLEQQELAMTRCGGDYSNLLYNNTLANYEKLKEGWAA